jgi:hypothetical protein
VVATEMCPQHFLNTSPALKPEDIAESVLYVLGTPPHVQVRTLCVCIIVASGTQAAGLWTFDKPASIAGLYIYRPQNSNLL